MKFKKITGKDVSANLPTLVGAGAGIMVARGISGSYTDSKNGDVLTEDQKKKKLHVAIASLVVGAAGFMAISGDDAVTKAAKGASLGLGVFGLLDMVSHASNSSSYFKKVTEAPTTTGKFLSNALGCACEQPTYRSLNRPAHRRALRMPEFVAPVQNDLSSLSPVPMDLAQLAAM